MLPLPFSDGTMRSIAAHDPATGLALVRVSAVAPPARPLWTPDRLEQPRYVFSAVPAVPHPTMVPGYISALEPRRSPAWPTDVWNVPASSGVTAGALLFTPGGEWIGIAGVEEGRLLVVPAAAVLNVAMQLSTDGTPSAGDLGVEVQSLGARVAAATGARAGVIVSWLEPRGAAADVLEVGDVIETLNGEAVPTPFAWQVKSVRLTALTSATLRVRRRGVAGDVMLTVPPAQAVRQGALGLMLTFEPGRGSRVTRVDPQTAADRAGLTAGDLLTVAGEQREPTPAQVRRAFDAVPDGGVLLVAVTRDTGHRLVALAR
jgi:S1-C subfamily serine protease